MDYHKIVEEYLKEVENDGRYCASVQRRIRSVANKSERYYNKYNKLPESVAEYVDFLNLRNSTGIISYQLYNYSKVEFSKFCDYAAEKGDAELFVAAKRFVQGVTYDTLVKTIDDKLLFDVCDIHDVFNSYKEYLDPDSYLVQRCIILLVWYGLSIDEITNLSKKDFDKQTLIVKVGSFPIMVDSETGRYLSRLKTTNSYRPIRQQDVHYFAKSKYLFRGSSKKGIAKLSPGDIKAMNDRLCHWARENGLEFINIMKAYKCGVCRRIYDAGGDIRRYTPNADTRRFTKSTYMHWLKQKNLKERSDVE